MKRYGMWIDGDWHEPASGAWLESVDPYRGDAWAEIPRGGAADVDRAVQAAHRQGLCFRGEPFGLRVLEPPASRWPARPAGGYGDSLAVLLEVVDGLYRQRPFAVLLADCGAYRLPLLQAAHQRYGVAAQSSGLPMSGWLGA